MIDAGTKPKETAILRLVEDMQLNPQIGGCCGQIAVDIQACSGQWFNPVIASQLYEVRKSTTVAGKSPISATGVTPVGHGGAKCKRNSVICLWL